MASLLLTGYFLASAIAQASPIKHQVVIHWGRIEGANRYEIQITKNDRLVTKAEQTQEKTSWEGSFSQGVYVFQVRALDKFGRPGSWTPAQYFFVPPPPPKLLLPNKSAEWETLFPKLQVQLKWQAADGISHYALHMIYPNGETQTRSVAGTEENLELPAGDFEWYVTSVPEASSHLIKQINEKKWESPRSEKRKFQIRLVQLDRPSVESPTGYFPALQEGKVSFQWKPVPKATSYRVKIVRNPDSNEIEREPEEKQWALTVSDHRVTVPLPRYGSYAWEVTAIAASKEAALAPAESEPASSTFYFHARSDIFRKTASIALTGGILPFKYSIRDTTNEIQGGLSSMASSLGLSARYWFSKHWGALLSAYELTNNVEGQSFTYLNLLAGLGGRLISDHSRLPAGINVWVLFADHSFMEVQKVFSGSAFSGSHSSSISANKKDAAGVEARLEVSHGLSERFLLTFQAAYFLPLFFADQSGSTLTRNFDHNFSLALQGDYWITASWAIGLNAGYQASGLSYRSSSGSTARELSSDALALQAVLQYALGN